MSLTEAPTNILRHSPSPFKTVCSAAAPVSSPAVPKSSARPLLARILETPRLTQIVPRLSPELLHRVIQTCGLEECGELVALATAEQLRRVLDLDLWRAPEPGRDERFDADRFGVWLDVLVDSDPDVAAAQLAKIDFDLVVGALAQHARVFDRAAVIRSASDDFEDATVGIGGDEATREVGGYLLVAKRAGSWSAIVAALISLEANHHDYFHRVMSGCRRLSNSDAEIDGLHDLLTETDQAMFELADARERRREQQGFTTPAQARAFLRMARAFRAGSDSSTPPSENPVARAYFRGIRSAAPESPAPDASADAEAPIVELLREAGVVVHEPPRALLAASDRDAPWLAGMQAHLQSAAESDQAAYATRTQELAYLANTLVAGSSIQGRPLTPVEASEAAAAVCNLALENWPTMPLADDFLVTHDLIAVFQVGWAFLHENVCMHTAQHLIDVLKRVRCSDREIQFGLDLLRIEMTKQWRAGTPWHARKALDAIAVLDLPAWAALLALIDELPVLHAAVTASRDSRTRSIAATAFEFIADNRQIASIRQFLQALPQTLRT
jgi:uncharacterized protein DUF6178